MEYTGTIVKAGEEVAKSGAKVFKVTIRSDGKDWDFTLFDPVLIALAEENFEQFVKYTAEKKDKFWNLLSLEPASSATPFTDNGDRQERIEAQVAYKIIARLWCADKLDDNDALVNELLDWLCSKVNVDSFILTKPKVETAQAKVGVQTPKYDESEVDMSPVKSFGELYTRANKYFKAMTKTDVLKALNVKDQMEIPDLDVAWNEIVVIKS